MTDTRKLGVENKDACPAYATVWVCYYCSFLNGNLAKISFNGTNLVSQRSLVIWIKLKDITVKHYQRDKIDDEYASCANVPTIPTMGT